MPSSLLIARGPALLIQMDSLTCRSHHSCGKSVLTKLSCEDDESLHGESKFLAMTKKNCLIMYQNYPEECLKDICQCCKPSVSLSEQGNDTVILEIFACILISLYSRGKQIREIKMHVNMTCLWSPESASF